jgi:hypothetical protein
MRKLVSFHPGVALGGQGTAQQFYVEHIIVYEQEEVSKLYDAH